MSIKSQTPIRVERKTKISNSISIEEHYTYSTSHGCFSFTFTTGPVPKTHHGTIGAPLATVQYLHCGSFILCVNIRLLDVTFSKLLFLFSLIFKFSNMRGALRHTNTVQQLRRHHAVRSSSDIRRPFK